jgi:hypothetical protein
MSLTGAGPDIFSTSPRRYLMTNMPEDKIPKNALQRERTGVRAKMPDQSQALDKLNRYPKT